MLNVCNLVEMLMLLGLVLLSSRRAVTDALADENLSRQLAEIQAQGQQQAFENAQSQFERDRAAAMGAEKIGLGSAESLAALGQRARAGDVEAAGLLETVGKDLMARDQAGLDLAYQDFDEQEIILVNSYSSYHLY